MTSRVVNHGMSLDAPTIILASGSPRRAELMRKHGYRVRIVKPPLEEPSGFGQSLSPVELAMAVSYFKAKCVAHTEREGWIIAGDTIVTHQGVIFGKPVDRVDAKRILTALTGTTHHVITGVTLMNARAHRHQLDSDSTAVTMRAMSDAEMQAYLDTRAWEGKAGAYGIQDRGDAFIDRIDGSFTNVVGFPMELIGRMLKEVGLTAP